MLLVPPHQDADTADQCFALKKYSDLYNKMKIQLKSSGKRKCWRGDVSELQQQFGNVVRFSFNRHDFYAGITYSIEMQISENFYGR